MPNTSKKDEKIDRIVAEIESGELDFRTARIVSDEEANRLFGSPERPPELRGDQTLRT
jgi:hypothetical protein